MLIYCFFGAMSCGISDASLSGFGIFIPNIFSFLSVDSFGIVVHFFIFETIVGLRPASRESSLSLINSSS